MSNLKTSLTSGQIAQEFNRLISQVSGAKKVLAEGRPAIPAGPNASPAIPAEAIAEILGTDTPKIVAACDAFLAALA